MSNKFLDKEGLEYYHETLNDNYLPLKYDKEKNSAYLRDSGNVVEGDHSFSTGLNSSALGPRSWAHGKENFAGAKGYYWYAIDKTNKKITLSNIARTLDTANSAIEYESGTAPTAFETGWEKGDLIALSLDSGEDTNHSERFYLLTIASVAQNVITVSDISELTSVTIPTSPDTSRTYDADNKKVVNISKPNLGEITFGSGATALGTSNKALADTSTTLGGTNYALGAYSTAAGTWNYTATGATAFGRDTKALGNYSTTMGFGTKAYGHMSQAEGLNSTTTTTAKAAHAEGYNTRASGLYSHAEGQGVNGSGASGENSHSEGYATKATANSAHAEGYYTQATGQGAHAEGYYTQATGQGAHAEGVMEANIQVTAKGIGAHADGQGTIASGNASHASGYCSVASGQASVAIGTRNEANGTRSFASGLWTRVCAADANGSTFGKYTYTTGDDSFVVGHYNKRVLRHNANATADYLVDNIVNYSYPLTNESDHRLFVVGNGTSSSNESDAFAVYADGVVSLSYLGGKDRNGGLYFSNTTKALTPSNQSIGFQQPCYVGIYPYIDSSGFYLKTISTSVEQTEEIADSLDSASLDVPLSLEISSFGDDLWAPVLTFKNLNCNGMTLKVGCNGLIFSTSDNNKLATVSPYLLNIGESDNNLYFYNGTFKITETRYRDQLSSSLSLINNGEFKVTLGSSSLSLTTDEFTLKNTSKPFVYPIRIKNGTIIFGNDDNYCIAIDNFALYKYNYSGEGSTTLYYQQILTWNELFSSLSISTDTSSEEFQKQWNN